MSVLIAGAGSIGKRHARALLDLGVRDLRVCDPRPQACAEIAAGASSAKLFDSYEAGLKGRPDAVLICTPTEMHVPMAIAAIEAGCHAFIEKPLSNSCEGVEELSLLAHSNNRKVMVGLCFRYHEGVLRAHEVLRSGRMGRLVCVRALVGEYLPDVRPDYRDVDYARHGGAFELMHDLDLALWMAGSPVKKVHAIFGAYGGIGIQAPDMVELLIDFEDPCAASVHLDFFQRPRRRQLELMCTNGVIVLEFARWDRCTLSTCDANHERWSHEEMETDRDDMFRAEDREFLTAIADDLPIHCTVAEGFRSLEVIQEAQGSHEQRR